MSYHHLGMEKEAAIQWKKVIEMAPGTKEAEDAIKQLKEHGLM